MIAGWLQERLDLFRLPAAGREFGFADGCLFSSDGVGQGIESRGEQAINGACELQTLQPR